MLISHSVDSGIAENDLPGAHTASLRGWMRAEDAAFMSAGFDSAVEPLKAQANSDVVVKLAANVMTLSDEKSVQGCEGSRWRRGRKAQSDRRHAGDLLKHANYNDKPDPAVKATVEKLVDTSKVIELERIDVDALPKKYGYRFVKRAFDIVSCSVALVVCAIPMGIIAIMIKHDSLGPVFYRQERLGMMGRPIVVTKFRSMHTDAETMGAQWAQGEDLRVTKVGAFLRKTRLDELPQFWAVMKGEMSLIGPRPEREVFYQEFEKYIHGFSQRMLIRPGISGLAQVNGGYDLLPEEKVLYDLEYIKSRNIAMDWEIIWKTVSVLFSHEGAR